MTELAAHLAMVALALASADKIAAPIQAACPEGVDPAAVRCVILRVPEDYSAPAGRLIDLYMVVVPAIRQPSEVVPLFPLAGGPGNSIADTAGWYLDKESAIYPLRRDRPVILLDQRGTGLSNPLHCPSLETRSALDRFYSADLVRQCRDRLAKENDLKHYGTVEAARDLESVREALAYENIDLWAISYGTVLAQVYLRDYPDRVRSAVLVGTAPLDSRFPLYHAANAQRVLDLLFFECQVDGRCNTAYPDLRNDWHRLLARLERDPPTVTLEGADGEAWNGELRRDVFAEAFRTLMGSAASLRRLPRVIHEAASDNWSPFLEALSGGGDSFFSSGLYLSAVCAESTARIEPEAIGPAVSGTFLGDYRVSAQRAACAEWPQSTLPEAFFRPVASDVPVLLLTGDLDQTTPPAWSYRVARTLSRARVVHMPHGGHLFWDWGEDNDAGECFDALTLDFYEHSDPQALDTSCAQAATAPPFLVSGAAN